MRERKPKMMGGGFMIVALDGTIWSYDLASNETCFRKPNGYITVAPLVFSSISAAYTRIRREFLKLDYVTVVKVAMVDVHSYTYSEEHKTFLDLAMLDKDENGDELRFY